MKRSGAVDFDKVLMLKDDEGKWAMYIKPENEKAFSVYPNKEDLNKFFTTVQQGNDEVNEHMRQDMVLFPVFSWDKRLFLLLMPIREKSLRQRLRLSVPYWIQPLAL